MVLHGQQRAGAWSHMVNNELVHGLTWETTIWCMVLHGQQRASAWSYMVNNELVHGLTWSTTSYCMVLDGPRGLVFNEIRMHWQTL